MPFLEVGRPETRRLADPQSHRPAEHGAADLSVSPRPRRHTITSTLITHLKSLKELHFETEIK